MAVKVHAPHLTSLRLLGLLEKEDRHWCCLQTLLKLPDLQLSELQLSECSRKARARTETSMLGRIRLSPKLKRHLARLVLGTDPTAWLKEPACLPPSLVELDLSQAPVFNPTYLLLRLQDPEQFVLSCLRVLHVKFRLVIGAWCTPGRNVKDAVLWYSDSRGNTTSILATQVRNDIRRYASHSKCIHLLPRAEWMQGRFSASLCRLYPTLTWIAQMISPKTHGELHLHS